MDKKNVEVSRDHLLFLSPGQTLRVDSTKISKGKNTFILFFTADFLDFAPSYYHIVKRFPFFNMNFLSIYYAQDDVGELYLDYMNKIYEEFQELNSTSIEIIKSLLTIVLFETKRRLESSLNTVSQNFSRKSEIAYRFENLIKQTEQKYQKLDFFADQLNISSTYLAECVKDTTKKTAKSILNDYVLLEAKNLLRNTTETIENIAFGLGFKDSSNFVNFYKKYSSITPSQERKKV